MKDFKKKIEFDLQESESNCLDDFQTFEEDFIKEFNQKLSAIQMDIVNVDKDVWEELKIKYAKQKNKIMKIIGAIE